MEIYKPKVILYTSSNIKNCPWCSKAKRWLQANQLEWTEIDVHTDSVAKESLLAVTKKATYPQLKVAGYYVIGFKEAILNKLLLTLRKEHKNEQNS
ncbi:hypothetical protein CL621_01110 [archaeon]|nr:hypothetical protein [archaeon]|tara:strand:- start:3477 stop:3764 length:288 start_codon:yes stop_codon:yes gene_type:complete